MPKPYPEEFREDVVRVARNRPDGVTLEQIAADFGVHPMTLSKWLRVCGRRGRAPGPARRAQIRPSCARLRRAQQAVGAGKRGSAPRGRVSVPGEPAGKRLYPLVSELAADGIPVAVACRVLKLARQPYYRWLTDTGHRRRVGRGAPR